MKSKKIKFTGNNRVGLVVGTSTVPEFLYGCNVKDSDFDFYFAQLFSRLVKLPKSIMHLGAKLNVNEPRYIEYVIFDIKKKKIGEVYLSCDLRR